MRGILLKGFLRASRGGRIRKRMRNASAIPETKRKRSLLGLTPSQAPSVPVTVVEQCSESIEVDEAQIELEVAGLEIHDEQGDEVTIGDFGRIPKAVMPNVAEKIGDEGGKFYDDINLASASREKDYVGLYPSVLYEGKTATVTLGVGQMVVLDGCAMVRVVKGQASMLGYFLPCGIDVLVCSSSKLSEAISIEARHIRSEGLENKHKETNFAYLRAHNGPESGDVNMLDDSEEDRRGKDLFGCVLIFSSHKLGTRASPELRKDDTLDRKSTFKLEVTGPQGRHLGRKRGRGEMETPDHSEADSSGEEDQSDEEESDSLGEAAEELDKALDAANSRKETTVIHTKSSRKRKNSDLERSHVKKQRTKMPEGVPLAKLISPKWRAAVDSILFESGDPFIRSKNGISTTDTPSPVVAILGAKNAGKSTFARFLVNSLLNRHKKVAYLDTDVGQPEFTLPGCVSLHILDQPIVGPPAMHLRTPERCFFYGDISPKSDPIMYGQNIADLYQHFCNHYHHNGQEIIPLVINTHGWVKGVGFDVLVDILSCTSPTHVVQLLTSSSKKNLPHGRFWDASARAKTLYVESAVEESATHKGARSAHHLRSARVLAYFQQCFGENTAPFPYQETKLFEQTAMSLVSEAPYMVPISALRIQHLHAKVPSNESLRSVNAALVGLSISPAQQSKGETNGISSQSPCIGLGIVRAIDVEKGVFYVITPVPIEQIQDVDTLLQGRIEIPVPLLMVKDYICPYLCREALIVEGVGAGAMKSSRRQMAKRP